MSTLANALREAESDGDSIYNAILDGVENTQARSTRTVITVQPYNAEDITRRLPLPIISASRRAILPLYGLQLLAESEELQIQQTVDLNDLFSMVESVNKYIVKSNEGHIIYGATEGSSHWQRLLCGTARRFILRLFDRTHQEAVYFIRRLAPTNPLLSCYLQRMDVFIPQCEYIGCVQQKWSPNSITIIIRNYLHENILKVEGPLCSMCSAYTEMEFDVLGMDTSLSVSKISHTWDESRAAYAINIFYLVRLDNTKKALILACAFLLEYIYFHLERSAGLCICMK